MNPFRNKIFNETVWAMIAKGIAILGGLFFTIFIPKLGSVEIYGGFSLLIAYISIFGIMFGAQINSAVKTELTKEKVGQTGYDFFNEASKIKIIFSVISSLLVILIAYVFKISVLIDNLWLFLILLATMNLWGLVVTVFETVHKLFFEAVVYFFEYAIQVELILFFYFRGSLTLEHILLAFIIGYVFSFILGLLIVRKLFKDCINYNIFTLKPDISRKILDRTILLSLTGGVLVGMAKIDSIIISFFMSIKEVGFYNIASDIVKSMPMLSVPIILGSLPLFFESESRVFFKKNVRTLTLINVGVFLLLFFFGNQIIVKIYGASFASTGQVMRILAIYPLFISLQTFIQEILILKDSIKHILLAGLIAVCLDIVLNLILIPSFGINGAAYASVLSAFAWLVISFLYAKEHIS